jgi:ATP/maltotriose-dependent transcriptional regulator MalT
MAAAEEATRDAIVYVSILVVPELVEAAARAGNTDVAAGALQRLAETTQPSGNDLALGIEARCRALLSEGETAEGLYQEAIDRLGRTQLRPDLARAHLLYGEWLRRQSRRLDARRHLRTAYDMLTAIGMEAFAERARRELVATGEQVRRRTDENSDQLTAQETLIARLARDGQSNAEIGAQLFISTRTVEWHLRKVFTKLGVSSRRQLQRALAADARHGPGSPPG